MKTLAEQYQLPLWMTEFTMGAMGTTGRTQDPFKWASLMHDLISDYNVSAVDYLWGFFGEWEGNATTLISLNNTWCHLRRLHVEQNILHDRTVLAFY